MMSGALFPSLTEYSALIAPLYGGPTIFPLASYAVSMIGPDCVRRQNNLDFFLSTVS